MPENIGEFVFPGDVVRDLKVVNGVILRGPGLHSHEEPNCLLVTRAGKLCFKPPNVYWVEGHFKRYYPKKGDLVVGIIKKSGNVCKVDIGSSELASLSLLSFEGATKKQKPDLQVGDVVYAKLLSAHREMEPELVCVDSYYKAGKLGPLSNDGFVMNVSLNFVNRILDVNSLLLRALGQKYVFEIAVGMNGKVWINGQRTIDVLNLMNALLAAERESNSNIVNVCRRYLT
uniref:Ribosomal RNA-processing protein 40 n=1 Tax=Photinus pyralis TaxID=7054 RepID=A0A1Y1LW03_PHOPY